MKSFLIKIMNIAGIVILGIALIYVIWQPVFPSSILINRMADAIDPKKVSLDHPAVIRFDLHGKGGGIYNIVVDKNEVKTVKGKTDSVDLIIFMEAKEFNQLIYDFASGKATESRLISLGLSDILRFSGDITVFQELFKGGK